MSKIYKQSWKPIVSWPVVTKLVLLLALSFPCNFPCPNAIAARSGLAYDVKITGIKDGKLHSLLVDISDTVKLRKERPPVSLALLRRRANRDIPTFLRALKAESYYGAEVASHIDEAGRPIRVTFKVSLGPPYLVKSVGIKPTGERTGAVVKMPEPHELGLSLGQPCNAAAVLEAQKDLIQRFKKIGFPFPRIVERKVVVYHGDKTVALTFLLDPGPLARFGRTNIVGLRSVDDRFVRSKVPWHEGEQFNAELFAQLRERLARTGLFSVVRVNTHENIQEGGLLPLTISVTERKHRTIGAAVSYKTDEGFGSKLSWEHRNWLGRGERLRLMAMASEIALAAEGGFRKPEFLRGDQSLTLKLRLAEDRPDAYVSQNLNSSALVDRTLGKGMIVGAGLAFKAAQVEQFDLEETYGLVSMPAHFDWDTSDSLLDPSRGGRFTLDIAPFLDTFGSDLSFLKGRGGYARYVPLFGSPSLVFAGQVAVGSMTGATRDTIPADERFYAGGGGSIRGYAFQSVGPLSGGEPLGGRSLLELKAEVRVKLTESIGFVTFLDGGSAFASETPGSGENLHWGTGVGLRYFTTIGPLRLDVGLPIDRREGIDDSFQVYVSLGQAF